MKKFITLVVAFAMSYGVCSAQYLQSDKIYGTGSAKTWDFSDVSGTVEFSDESGDKETWYNYSYLSGQGKLSYNSNFDGAYIAFMGTYPIRDGKYAQDGTIRIYPTVNGYIRVTFEETGSSDDVNAHRRYLAINGNRTNYWVSRPRKDPETGERDPNYVFQQSVTTGSIPVKVGNVYLSGISLDESPKDNAAIRISKIEFTPYNENEGVVDGMFTTRTYEYSVDRGIISTTSVSTSRWVYEGYRNGTHGLVGGVEDNGIVYISSKFVESGKDNGNGNIKFSIDSDGNPFLSCKNGSTIYVPVPSGSSGDIKVICTHDKTSGDDVRCFDLYKNGSLNTQQFILMQKGDGYTASFTSNQITEYNGNTYLELHDNNKEMKVLSIEVKISSTYITGSGIKYTFEVPADDYDHGTLGEHDHAVFNYTDGDVAPGSDKDKGSLTMNNGAVLSAKTIDTSSETDVIHSYNDGELVRYKNSYYGTLQLLSSATYTLKAPKDYYMTTSVRLHGYNNKDDGDNTKGDTYVSRLGNGIFDGNDHDNTYLKFPRDSKNATTSTLDFSIPATSELSFNLAGYQMLGVIDAILVRKEDVPNVKNRVKYTKPNGQEVYLSKDEIAIEKGGKITYTPSADDNVELWWYFRPFFNDRYGSRGRTGDIIVENEGIKDENYTKTYSVRNYKFVKTLQKGLTTDYDDLSVVYDAPANYSLNGESDIMAVADDGELELTVKEDGYFYFYLRDKDSDFNSVLVMSGFGPVTGLEELEIDNVLPSAGRDGFIYNIYGQRVDENYRGVVIKNGCKYVQK